jgi:outer membrane biosynthesis protein TonB
MELTTALKTGDTAQRELRHGMALSMLLHLLVLLACVFAFRQQLTSAFVAAGEGEGGGGGGAIEVGVISASQLGFAKPRPISHVGETDDTTNNTVVETKAPTPPPDAEVIPRTDRKTPEKKPIKASEKVTERPTANQNEQVFSKKPLTGRSTNTNVEVGRSYGSPTPILNGGVGLGSSSAAAGASGVPGGSEYGRRIQMILSRNYNPPQVSQASQTHYVIIQLRISRDGQIRSLAGGRVPSQYIRQTSQFDLVNRAAERAILASNPLPPFPPGFLASTQDAVAEIWFRFPKLSHRSWDEKSFLRLPSDSSPCSPCSPCSPFCLCQATAVSTASADACR